MAAEPSEDLSVRILFAGACQGNFSKFLKKVEKVNTKNGPFAALMCVGKFFGDTDSDNAEEFMQFLNSHQKMPITTYILGAYGHGSKEAKEKLQEVECNIHLLGKRGILALQNGLSIAYLEGTYDPDSFDPETSNKMHEDQIDGQYYTKEDVSFLKHLVQSKTGDIDFFLTCDWPANITTKLLPNSVEGPVPEGSQHISSLLSVIRPRYHFTSQPPLFFSRLPYKNPDLGAGTHITRFTSLCPFGSGKKQNLFALCLTPAQYMSHEKLLEIPYDATEYPFDTEDRKREFEVKVNGDVPVAVDSSCTPPGPPSQMMNYFHWQTAGAGVPQASAFYHSREPSGSIRIELLNSTFNNLRNQNSIHTLMQNIGRSSAVTQLGIMGSTNHAATVFSNQQGNFGNQSLRQNYIPSMPITSNHDLSFNYTNVNQVSNLGIGALQQQLSEAQQSGDCQNLLLDLLQNPQMLNTAAQMGLLPQNLVNQPYQQNFEHLVNPIPRHSSSVETSSSIPPSSNVKTGGSMNNSQKNKRYKANGKSVNKHVIKDRRKTCFVGQLSKELSQEDIMNFFSQAGEVTFVSNRQNDSGHENSWAFVQYRTQEARNNAVAMLNETVFAGKKIIVKPANDELKFDPNQPVNECSPSSDKNLLVSIGNECYLAVDKGPITNEHVVVVPTSHYPSTLRLTESCYEEMELYLKSLKAMFEADGKALIAFERFLQIQKLHGNHTYISVISIDPSIAETAKDMFIQMDTKQNAEWNQLPPEDCGRTKIRDIVGDEEYFLVILPDGSKLVRPVLKNSKLPVSFGRDVLAHLVNKPERADWKICLSSQEEEMTRVQAFKDNFKTYDFPNQS